MKRYRTIVTVFVLLGLLAVGLSVQAESDNRYFVKSDKVFWKNTFGARHVFEHGFSANLSSWQLRLAKVFNVDVEPIPMLQILPESIQGPPLDGILGGMPEVSAPKKDKPVKPGKPGGGDRVVPSDQTPWGIEAIYNNIEVATTSGGENVTVAILDTGINKDHPDLARRVVQCKDFTHPRAVVRDGKCSDLNGHGTHVAGIVAADGGEDGLGIYGVAPEVSLWIYKVCDASGSCWADDIQGAINAAIDQSVDIISLSVGSNMEVGIITAAIDRARDNEKKVLVVVAAGNDGPEQGTIDYPAAHEYAVSVGAFDSLYNVPEWSSRGINTWATQEIYKKEANEVEFAAPGHEIESTWKDGGYAKKSGTSMATPFITGLAAKLWDGAAETTREVLQSLAIPNDIGAEGDDDAAGFGFPTVPGDWTRVY